MSGDDRVYRTARGDLMSRLECGCVEPGLWWVEGIQVRRVSRGRWLVVWEVGKRSEPVDSFEDALGRIAEELES